jgi:hypothetical protein
VKCCTSMLYKRGGLRSTVCECYSWGMLNVGLDGSFDNRRTGKGYGGEQGQLMVRKLMIKNYETTR